MLSFISIFVAKSIINQLRMIKRLFAVFLTSGFFFLSQGATPADDYSPEIFASVYSTNSWKEHNFDEVGMYRFRADRYDRQLVMQDPYIDASGGGAMTDDFYFCTQEFDYGYWVEVTHYIVDPDDWTITTSLTDGFENAVATDLTYDPMTAKVFGCFNGDGDKMVFGTIDVATGEVFRIADIETPWIACATDKNGNLYAIDMAGNLLSVDKIYGKTEKLGNLGFSATRRSTGAIDTRTGIFYVVVTNSRESDDPWIDYELNESHLYAVDITNATATHLYEFEDGEALGGMYIPGAAAADDAPAQVTDLVLDFPDGSLSGTVSFTVPATTFDGNPATGSVKYLVRANGSLLAQGSATYGEKVSVRASVGEGAFYKIELRLTNAAGHSPKTKTQLWIGPDMPQNITTPALSYADGKFMLSWEAPSESENGGYFDPEKITYKVVRQPGNVTVAENYTATAYTEPITVPEGVVAYSYDVTMIYDGTSRMPVSSNVWRLGSAKIPYKATFEDESSLNDFTRIDVAGDKIEWYHEPDFYIEDTDELIPTVCMPYSSSDGADDWLITPPFRLEKDCRYKLVYESLTDYQGAEPLLAVYLGSAPAVSAMTTSLQPATAVTSLQPEEHTIDIDVPETGIYHIGFHACSEPDRSGIAIHSIRLEADLSGINALETGDNVTVTASGNTIFIAAPADTSYNIYTPDGRCAARGNVGLSEETSVTLSKGIYIVSAGNRTVRIVVR